MVAYQEKEAPWAGVLAFSSEELARRFWRESGCQAREVAALPVADRAAVGSLIRQVKGRAIRCLFLDLDYRRGICLQVEFEGEDFGEAREKRFTTTTPPPHRH